MSDTFFQPVSGFDLPRYAGVPKNLERLRLETAIVRLNRSPLHRVKAISVARCAVLARVTRQGRLGVQSALV